MTRKSLLQYLPIELQTDPILVDVFTEFDESFVQPLEDFYNRLLLIRDPNQIDVEMVVLFREMCGLLDIDTALFSDSERRRFISELVSFYELSGTSAFIDFLSYAISVKLDLINLYTEDYSTFDSVPGTFIEDGGTWYPTAHVDVSYNPNINPVVDSSLITSMFYKLAPMNLVLRNIIAAPAPLQLDAYYLNGEGVTQYSYVVCQ